MSVPAIFALLCYVSSINGESRHLLSKRLSEGKESLIVGGTPVDIIRHLSLALLTVYLEKQEGRCTGTVIHVRFVLTAGGCLQSNIDHIDVIVGNNDPEKGALFVTKQYKVHPDYKPGYPDHNVGLVHTLSDIHTPLMKLALPTTKINPASLVDVVGWGKPSAPSKPDKVLREVKLTVITQADCQAAFKNRRVISLLSFCAAAIGKGVCLGDAGAPAIDSTGIQVGIVESGIGCTGQNLPTLFTNVAHVRSWISSILIGK